MVYSLHFTWIVAGFWLCFFCIRYLIKTVKIYRVSQQRKKLRELRISHVNKLRKSGNLMKNE